MRSDHFSEIRLNTGVLRSPCDACTSQKPCRSRSVTQFRHPREYGRVIDLALIRELAARRPASDLPEAGSSFRGFRRSFSSVSVTASRVVGALTV